MSILTFCVALISGWLLLGSVIAFIDGCPGDHPGHNGDTRVIERFLIVPRIVDGKFRCFVWARWQQELIEEIDSLGGGIRWYDTKWLDA